MKRIFLLLPVTIALFSSCTTSYKTGQTPDDVYFSPAREVDEYVNTEKEEDRNEYRYSDEYYEDRYLRMKVRNRYRWNELDDWYYGDYRNRYNVYLGCCFCKTGWSPYSYWNSYHNPYYNNYVLIKNVKTPVYNKPRTFNLNAYNPAQSNTRNYSNTKNNPSSTSNNTYTPRPATDRENSGNRLRDIFRGSSNSSSSSSNNTSTQSSNSSGSGSSKPSGSGSAPVRRF